MRTYAYDIGEELGCGAHLGALRRTKSGRFDVTSAITVDEVRNGDPAEVLRRTIDLPTVSRLRGA